MVVVEGEEDWAQSVQSRDERGDMEADVGSFVSGLGGVDEAFQEGQEMGRFQEGGVCGFVNLLFCYFLLSLFYRGVRGSA